MAECKFKDVLCHTCGKRGHIAKVCRSKEKFRNTKQPVTGSHQKQANLVQLTQPDDSTDESDIHFQVLKVGSEWLNSLYGVRHSCSRVNYLRADKKEHLSRHPLEVIPENIKLTR